MVPKRERTLLARLARGVRLSFVERPCHGATPGAYEGAMAVRSRRSLLLALGVGIALGSAPAAAQVLPHPPTLDTLPNGLRVVTVPFDAPGIAAYYTLVRTGSRDEVEAGYSGFAHFFEHMMFRGTRTRSAREYEHEMQRLGADNNAYTTQDFTLYTVTVPAGALADLVPVEADRFRNLSYAEPAFQTEARAVLGEYNKGAASPMLHMWQGLSELAFTRHTYGHTTIGYLRDIQAMPSRYDYAQRFFQRYYTPDNCTIIAAGDVRREAVLALVQQHYGDWQGRRDTPAIPAEPPQADARRRDLLWEGASPPRMLVGWATPAFGLATRDSVALDVVHALLFSPSSALYQRLVVSSPRLLALESWADHRRRDAGLFVVEATLRSDAGFDEVQAAFDEALAALGRGEVDPQRLADVLSHLRYAMPMNAQTPAAAADLVARFMALTGEPDAYERYNTALGTVTADDVARVARTWLVPSRRNLVTLTPASAAERAPAGALRVGPSAAPAAPPPAAPTAAPTAAPARPSAARPASPRRPR